MTSQAPQREPIFNVPAVVTAMLVVLAGVHVLRQAFGEANAEWLLLALAFIPDRYAGHAAGWPGGTISAWTSPLTHMAVHGDWTHLAVNSASLLAFGGIIARRTGAVRFIAFTLFAGLAGALAFYIANPAIAAPMIGASGAIAGMMAAALRLLFSAVDSAPHGAAGEIIRYRPDLIKLTGLAAALSDRRIRSATVVWLALNALGAYGLGTPGHVGEIAWESHIGGFLAGLFGFGWFDAVRSTGPNEISPASEQAQTGERSQPP